MTTSETTAEEPLTEAPVAPTVVTAQVLVIGGGPSGAAAAIELARRGVDVVVVDKARFPRDKCCGDGLTTLALRHLDALGVDLEGLDRLGSVEGAWLRSPTGREVEVRLPAGRGRYAAVAPRMDLDATILETARRAGARIHTGCGFAGLDPAAPGEVRVRIEGLGTVSTRFVIAADGMWSPVRRALGLTEPDYRGEWHAFRQYASQVTGTAASRLHVWFDADLLPGYAWSFPLPDGRANIGFGVLRDGERRIQDMARLWSDLWERDHVRTAMGPDAVLEGRHTAWPIPARIDEAVVATGRFLFVGDAARATDLLTGEGIGQALLTGVEAARAILDSGGADAAEAAVRDRYRSAVRHHLYADHRMSRVLGRVLARRWGARGAIGLLARVSESNRTRFARWMFEDEPRAVVLTPSRWHRDFLDLDGVASSTSPSPS
jgi:geranylgeranyl reductase family protein